MSGGILQLVAYGAQDLYITGQPQITFFKTVYIGATPCSPWNPSNKPSMVNQILETESQVPFHAMGIFYTNFGLLPQ